jgi:hypothetical protein
VEASATSVAVAFSGVVTALTSVPEGTARTVESGDRIT